MTRLISMAAALMMLMSLATVTTIEPRMNGGEPVAVSAAHTAVIRLDANITTGYDWHGFVLGGDAVEIDEAASGYVSDPNPNMLDGVGGTHVFTLKAVKPGESIVRFTYARGWENEWIDEVVIWATVDEQMNLYTDDVTGTGVLRGTVLEVNEAEHSVLLNTERLGEVVARFDEEMALPVVDESITIYTNGTMTMSLPGIVNVIAWESVPSEQAR